MKRMMYVGTYSRPDCFGESTGFHGHGEGVYVLSLDEDTGALALERVHRGILNPSWLTLDRAGRRLYCVHELDTYEGEAGGAVSAYAVREDGSLGPLGTRLTHGAAPCHVALSPRGDALAVANYTGGSASVYAVTEDGRLGEARVIRHAGSGPNAARQRGPHVHSMWFTPTGGAVVAADLGTDTLTAYTPDSATPLAIARAQPGDGPRMMAYHPRHNRLYVVGEMACTVASYACDGQCVPTRWLSAAQTLGRAPQPSETCADIHISADGHFLYASTRGDDSLTVFSIAEADGALAPVQRVPSGGRTPRGFALSPSGRWLLCGNQDSDEITVFGIDKETGKLTQHGRTEVPSPVCLVFAP